MRSTIAHVVGHELVEAHVDRPVGGQHVAVAHARAEHPLDALDPVRADRDRVGMGHAHAARRRRPSSSPTR